MTLLVVLALLALYLLPTFVALRRRKRNYEAITTLNIFLGWTFVGWVAALCWAMTVDRNA